MLLKGTLKMASAQNKFLFTQFHLIGSKYGVCCISSQSFEEFGAGSWRIIFANAICPKTALKKFNCFLHLNLISVRA